MELLFFIWQGAERFYCGWSYIYGPCILAISGRFLCATGGYCAEQNKRGCFFFTHKVVWLAFHNMPLSSNNDYVLHHCKLVVSPSLCVSPLLFPPCFPSFVFPAGRRWFEVMSCCRTALLWLESTSLSRSILNMATLSVGRMEGTDTNMHLSFPGVSL